MVEDRKNGKLENTLLRPVFFVLGGIALLAILYYFFDPMEYSWMPQCIFHRFTGLQCMGCGSQRMLHSLLHGDFAGAFRANAFLLCSLPFIGFLLFIELSRKSFPCVYARTHSRYVIITISAMLGAWLILRNIIGI